MSPITLPRDTNGMVYRFSSVGSYPLFFLTAQDQVYCSGCADHDDAADPEAFDRIVSFHANFEDPSLFCDGCSERIKSAYADPEET